MKGNLMLMQIILSMIKMWCAADYQFPPKHLTTWWKGVGWKSNLPFLARVVTLTGAPALAAFLASDDSDRASFAAYL